jgi:hypothetical protein
MLSWQVAPFSSPSLLCFFIGVCNYTTIACRDKTRSPLTGESVRFLPETNLRSANLMSHPSILLRPVLFSGAPAMAMLITIFGHRTTKVQRRSALLQVKYILLLFAVASGRARYRRVDASTDAFGREPGRHPMPVPEPYAGRCSAREMPKSNRSAPVHAESTDAALQLRCWRWATGHA